MDTPTRRKLIRLIFTGLAVCVIGGLSLSFAYTLYKSYKASLPPNIDRAFPYREIRIGVDASFPPFAVDNGQSMYGLDIDLGNAIGEEIGFPVRFVNMGFDGLYDSVIADQVDIVISALRVDPSRMAEVRYTQHYFDNGLVLVTPADSLITMMEFMEGYRIAYEFGSVADAKVRNWEQRIGRMHHMPYELPQYALDAVRLEHADSALVDTTSYLLYLRDHPDWNAQYHYITHEVYAVAVRIDRLDTWKMINFALQALKESGELDRIIVTWL